MKIIKIENNKLKEHYFKIENKFNLNLMLYPLPDFTSSMAIFSTHFGSINNQFKLNINNEQTTHKVPDGVAHYLEHKLFENKNNSTFNMFANTGAITNAFTSFNLTAFFFLCTYNFYDSLKILLNFVQNPNFTEENINKERGIIEQEIQMYEDDPENKLIMNCLKALYHKHPVRIDVGGSTKSIQNINVDTLNTCYNSFYNLNNMGLIIAGNFDFEKTLKTIETNLQTPKNPNLITSTQFPNEPLEVAKHFIETKMPVLLTYFCFGYKIKPCSPDKIIEQNLLFEVVCELITGKGSNLFSLLLEQNLVTDGLLTYEIVAGDEYFSILFSGQSTNYKKVFELLNQAIAQAQLNGFDNELFNLIKKQTYYDQIINFNSVKSVAKTLLNSFTYDCSAFKTIDLISDLNLEKINKQVQKINLKNSAISIIQPN